MVKIALQNAYQLQSSMLQKTCTSNICLKAVNQLEREMKLQFAVTGRSFATTRALFSAIQTLHMFFNKTDIVDFIRNTGYYVA